MISSDDACTVISCECAVVLDVCLECEVPLDTVDASEGSDAASLSDCVELSSSESSGMDSSWKSCDGFVTRGRMKDHGGASLIMSTSSGSRDCASHSSSFFATQGFCVHRSLEKYALQACKLDNGWP